MSWYRGRSDYYGGFAPYVPVGQKLANAKMHAAQVAKKENRELAPIVINGKQIAKTFWGKAWCENLERYSDYANRLPRGRTYVRNGSVVDLQISQGKLAAIVAGSEAYTITISISTLEHKTWEKIKQDCTRSIDSLIDLLRGKFDKGVMARLTQKETGLFPHPKEIKMKCSCPDSAGVCKHIAAVMYGVGARLDSSPELLFVLRNVDHLELISQAATTDNIDESLGGKSPSALAGSDLGELFGIEIDAAPTADEPEKAKEPAKPTKPSKVKAAKKVPKQSAKRTAVAKIDVVTQPAAALPATQRVGIQKKAVRKELGGKKPGRKKPAARKSAKGGQKRLPNARTAARKKNKSP